MDGFQLPKIIKMKRNWSVRKLDTMHAWIRWNRSWKKVTTRIHGLPWFCCKDWSSSKKQHCPSSFVCYITQLKFIKYQLHTIHY